MLLKESFKESFLFNKTETSSFFSIFEKRGQVAEAKQKMERLARGGAIAEREKKKRKNKSRKVTHHFSSSILACAATKRAIGIL
jgi:hypothetical protein